MARLMSRPLTAVLAPEPAAPATAETLARSFAEDGFLPGLPPGFPAEAAAIDRRIARYARCPGCKRRGLDYRPYHHPQGRRYRVAGVCPACHAAEEF